jgi:hypothetical protein
VIDVLDREVECVLVPLRIAGELAAAIGQYAQQVDVVALKQWQNTVVEQIRRGDRCLAIIELGKGNLGLSVDERLLINPSTPFQIADIERVLGAAIARMLALEFAMRLLFSLGLFQRNHPGFGQDQALLPLLDPASARDSPCGTRTPDVRLSFS